MSLRRQIWNDTAQRRSLVSTSIGSKPGDRTVYGIKVESVTLGGTALGLTWASVVAMLLETGMWASAWKAERKRTMPVKDEERLSSADDRQEQL